MSSFKTPKGTTLPLLKLRGKDYLEVKYRLVWFLESRENWSIETEIVSRDDTSALIRAVVKNEASRIMAIAHKFENAEGFQDFLEKAETGAIGRALAMIGFGTQFSGNELVENENGVDSPINLPKPQPDKCTDPKPLEGDENIIRFGWAIGKRFDELTVDELTKTSNFITKQNITSPDAQHFVKHYRLIMERTQQEIATERKLRNG